MMKGFPKGSMTEAGSELQRGVPASPHFYTTLNWKKENQDSKRLVWSPAAAEDLICHTDVVHCAAHIQLVSIVITTETTFSLHRPEMQTASGKLVNSV